MESMSITRYKFLRSVKNFLDFDTSSQDFEAVGKGHAVVWLETFTKVLRANLPAGEFVITHAREFIFGKSKINSPNFSHTLHIAVAPWFGKGQPYAQLNETVGDLIDWYNVQFYSQGLAYTTCNTLIFSSGGDFPGTSVMEIVDSGIPQHKVVIGKPGTPALVGTPVPSDGGSGGGGTQEANGGGTQKASGGGGTQEVSGSGTQEAGGFDLEVITSGTLEASDSTKQASTGGTKQATKAATGTKIAIGGHKRADFNPHQNGFLEIDTLAQCLVSAKAKGWNAGVMVWEVSLIMIYLD